jgi:hypothetical protein
MPIMLTEMVSELAVRMTCKLNLDWVVPYCIVCLVVNSLGNHTN